MAMLQLIVSGKKKYLEVATITTFPSARKSDKEQFKRWEVFLPQPAYIYIYIYIHGDH